MLDIARLPADAFADDHHPPLGVMGPEPVVEVERLAGLPRVLEGVAHPVAVAVVLVLEEERGRGLDLTRPVPVDREDLVVPLPGVVRDVVGEPARLAQPVFLVLVVVDDGVGDVGEALLTAFLGRHRGHADRLRGAGSP
nr:hypothetical protein [Nocardioides stalactiti]